MRLLSIVLIIAMSFGMCACTGFVNTRTHEMYTTLPDGRVVRTVQRESDDFSGSIAGNTVGLAANVLASGANTAFSTNWGIGYPANRAYVSSPDAVYGSHWGSYGSGYGNGYYGSAPAYDSLSLRNWTPGR